MTVLIHLMDVYSYIFVIKCHLCISEKLCFYTVYIAVILLLDSCMEAIISAAKRTAHAGIILVPRALLTRGQPSATRGSGQIHIKLASDWPQRNIWFIVNMNKNTSASIFKEISFSKEILVSKRKI